MTENNTDTTSTNDIEKDGSEVTEPDDGLNTALIKLINKWVSCSRPTTDLRLKTIVEETQMHKHTKKSCLKRGNGCRFNFPRPPSDRTMISRPISELFPELDDEGQKAKIKRAKDVISKVKKALEEIEDDCHDYDDNLKKFLDEKCDKLDIEEYHKCLQISASGGYLVILKRKVSEKNVNNYHPKFQKSWNGNTDVSICLDSYAVITYVTDYLTKGEKNLTRLLKAALKEKSGADHFNLMNHLKRTYFFNTQTCLCEAAYKLIPGLNLKGSTTKCLFVASGFKEKRRMYLHQIPNDENADDDDDDDPMKEIPQKKTSAKFKKVKNMEGKNYILPESKHDKYEMRPEDSECNVIHGAFEKMCFAKFSILYDYDNQTNGKICWHPINVNCQGIHECMSSIDDVQELFKPKSKNKTTNDEETEDETDEEEFENKCSDQDNTKQPEALISKTGWRWGDVKNKQTDTTSSKYEIGYTKHNYNLIKKKYDCHKFMKIYEDFENDNGHLPEVVGFLPQWIRLSNGRTMKLRTKPYILRMFSYPKDIFQKKYSELLLFTAWRKEEDFWLASDTNENNSNANDSSEDIIQDKEESEEKKLLTFDDPEFEVKIEQLSNEKQREWENNRQQIYPFSRKMTEVKRLMESEHFQRSTTIYDSINPQAQQENEEIADDLEYSDEEDDISDDPEDATIPKKRKRKQNEQTSFEPEKCIFKKVLTPDNKDELFQSVRDLTFEQRVVFDKYIHYFKSIKCVRNGGDIMPEPPRIIVHGKFLHM